MYFLSCMHHTNHMRMYIVYEDSIFLIPVTLFVNLYPTHVDLGLLEASNKK